MQQLPAGFVWHPNQPGVAIHQASGQSYYAAQLQQQQDEMRAQQQPQGYGGGAPPGMPQGYGAPAQQAMPQGYGAPPAQQSAPQGYGAPALPSGMPQGFGGPPAPSGMPQGYGAPPQQQPPQQPQGYGAPPVQQRPQSQGYGPPAGQAMVPYGQPQQSPGQGGQVAPPIDPDAFARGRERQKPANAYNPDGGGEESLWINFPDLPTPVGSMVELHLRLIPLLAADAASEENFVYAAKHQIPIDFFDFQGNGKSKAVHVDCYDIKGGPGGCEYCALIQDLLRVPTQPAMKLAKEIQQKKRIYTLALNLGAMQPHWQVQRNANKQPYVDPNTGAPLYGFVPGIFQMKPQLQKSYFAMTRQRGPGQQGDYREAHDARHGYSVVCTRVREGVGDMDVRYNVRPGQPMPLVGSELESVLRGVFNLSQRTIRFRDRNETATVCSKIRSQHAIAAAFGQVPVAYGHVQQPGGAQPSPQQQGQWMPHPQYPGTEVNPQTGQLRQVSAGVMPGFAPMPGGAPLASSAPAPYQPPPPVAPGFAGGAVPAQTASPSPTAYPHGGASHQYPPSGAGLSPPYSAQPGYGAPPNQNASQPMPGAYGAPQNASQPMPGVYGAPTQQQPPMPGAYGAPPAAPGGYGAPPQAPQGYGAPAQQPPQQPQWGGPQQPPQGGFGGPAGMAAPGMPPPANPGPPGNPGQAMTAQALEQAMGGLPY